MYRDISLNVDAARGELQVRPLDRVVAVVLVTDQVAWFTMGNKPFVNLRYLGWPEAPEGFFEVVRDGQTPLVRRVTKNLRNDTNGSGYAIGYDDPDYDYTVNSYFRFQETFYALEQGKLKKIGKRNLLRRLKTPAGNPVLGVDRISWHPYSDKAPAGQAGSRPPRPRDGRQDGRTRLRQLHEHPRLRDGVPEARHHRPYCETEPRVSEGEVQRVERWPIRSAMTVVDRHSRHLFYVIPGLTGNLYNKIRRPGRVA